MLTPNGAECVYHRVDVVDLDINTLLGGFVVGHYLSEVHARLSRSPAWQIRYDGFQATTTLTANAEAYSYLKALPEWADAVDV